MIGKKLGEINFILVVNFEGILVVLGLEIFFGWAWGMGL